MSERYCQTAWLIRQQLGLRGLLSVYSGWISIAICVLLPNSTSSNRDRVLFHHHHPFTPYKGLGCLLWGQLLFRCRAMFFAVIQSPHPSGHDLRSSFPVNLLISIPSIWFVFIILYCSFSWSANISLTRKMESLNHKGLKWCFDNNSYNSLLHASATMPIAYQKIERDLRLFAAISSGATCINFHDHFTVQCDNRSLRSNVKPKLVAPTFKRKIVLQSCFPKVTQLVNDLLDSTEIDLITPSHNFKDQLRQYFLLLTRTKYDLNRTCTWHIKCKCSFCVS